MINNTSLSIPIPFNKGDYLEHYFIKISQRKDVGNIKNVNDKA